MRAFLISALALAATNAVAQGPGSRIGTTPQVPVGPEPIVTQLVERCGALRGEERERCLKRARSADPSLTKPSGPNATGMSPGRTGSTAPGTTAGTFGSSAPFATGGGRSP
ncbi:MAG TPA: hypothetical protein VFV74_01295 [Burkholderiales bacterium]|nr:hypothetical protein [Burkholderiales bacterium]